MYQTAGSNILMAYEACFNVPIIQRQIIGASVNTQLEYNEVCPGDEVEDLFELLRDVVQQFPTVKGVACGAILSNYQRHRLEHVCTRLGLTVLSYLWQKDRNELLQEMIFENNMEILLVKVAGAGLNPQKHLGKRLKDLYPSLLNLHKKYGLDLCGEGGEYESLVLDAPFFHKRIEILSSKIIEDEEDPDVGNLFISSFNIVDKVHPVGLQTLATPPIDRLNQSIEASIPTAVEHIFAEPNETVPRKQLKNRIHVIQPARIHWKRDGFGHSELITAVRALPTERMSIEDIYRSQTIAVMERLVLSLATVRKEDVVFVHLYLHDMSMFNIVNATYCKYFGLYPPSRSCVQLALPNGVYVALEACILRNSYDSMVPSSSPAGSNRLTVAREALHVQSMSQWAPLCIGPYCQANLLQNFIVFVAGQIPLQPGTMSLRRQFSNDTISREDLMLDLALCLRHVYRVLTVLQSDMHHLISVVVYLNIPLIRGLWTRDGDGLYVACRELVKNLIIQNRFAGDSDAAITAAKQRKQNRQGVCIEADSETEESADESIGEEQVNLGNTEGIYLPSILLIGVPGLPRNASCEVETIAVDKSRLRKMGWKSLSGSAHTILGQCQQLNSLSNPTYEQLDIEDWPIWSESAKIRDPQLQSSLLEGYVTLKTYPGTICSGVLDVFVVESNEQQLQSPAVTEVTTIGVQLLRNAIQQIASMRWNRLIYIKLLFDPSVFECSPESLVHHWQDSWQLFPRKDGKKYSDISNQHEIADDRIASVIALPVQLLSSSTTSSHRLEGEFQAELLLQVLFLAADTQQLEAESWVNLTSNHCQGS